MMCTIAVYQAQGRAAIRCQTLLQSSQRWDTNKKVILNVCMYTVKFFAPKSKPIIWCGLHRSQEFGDNDKDMMWAIVVGWLGNCGNDDNDDNDGNDGNDGKDGNDDSDGNDGRAI